MQDSGRDVRCMHAAEELEEYLFGRSEVNAKREPYDTKCIGISATIFSGQPAKSGTEVGARRAQSNAIQAAYVAFSHHRCAVWQRRCAA